MGKIDDTYRWYRYTPLQILSPGSWSLSCHADAFSAWEEWSLPGPLECSRALSHLYTVIWSWVHRHLFPRSPFTCLYYWKTQRPLTVWHPTSMLSELQVRSLLSIGARFQDSPQTPISAGFQAYSVKYLRVIHIPSPIYFKSSLNCDI